MKTLYVSDLDGTLLNSDKKLSDKTKKIINQLVKNTNIRLHALWDLEYVLHCKQLKVYEAEAQMSQQMLM